MSLLGSVCAVVWMSTHTAEITLQRERQNERAQLKDGAQPGDVLSGDLLDWITAQGGDISKVVGRQSGEAGGGMGLFTTVAVGSKETLFRIPRACILTEAVVSRSVVGGALLEHG